MERVLVFVVAPVAINTLIGIKVFPQVIQIFTCVGKCRPKGHKGPLSSLLVIFVLYIKFLSFIFMCVYFVLFL